MKIHEAIQKQEWLVNFLEGESRINEDIENIYFGHAKDVLKFLKEESEGD